jgi:hypothetical protein
MNQETLDALDTVEKHRGEAAASAARDAKTAELMGSAYNPAPEDVIANELRHLREVLCDCTWALATAIASTKDY